MDCIDHRYAVVGKVVYRSFEVCQIFGSQSIHSSRMYFHIDYRTRSASSPLKIYREIFTDLSCNITVEKDGQKKNYINPIFFLLISAFCIIIHFSSSNIIIRHGRTILRLLFLSDGVISENQTIPMTIIIFHHDGKLLLRITKVNRRIYLFSIFLLYIEWKEQL